VTASRQGNLSRYLVAALIAAIASLVFWTGTAHAASGQISIIGTNAPPSSPPQLSGAQTNYVINFTCSATEVETCGSNPTVRIPIDVTSSFPDTPPLSDWTFDVNGGGTPELIIGWHLDTATNEIVVELDPDEIDPGDSKTFNLSVAPPNGFTPDGTTWEIQPTFQSSTIPETEAEDPALGEAQASANLATSKNTNDGGSVYVIGNQVIYNITASCNPGFPRGSLYLTEANLVDTLPPEVTFVSADPAPTSVSGGTLTWDFTNPGTMPPGCVPGAGGTSTYQVIVEIPTSVPDATVLHNSVTLTGTAIGNPDDELTSSANKDVTAISEPPTDPGNFLGKGSLGPLEIEGAGLKGTYPGHWIQPASTFPSTNPGAAEGRYTMTVAYPASRAFETDLVDPMPCLTNQTGVQYDSLPVTGDVDGSGSAPVCAQPAFHPTAVRIMSASMPQAAAAGYEIELILTDGSVVTVPVGAINNTAAYFPVPSANVGQVTAVRIPPSSDLTDRGMTIDVWGYADPSVEAGEILNDIAKATAYPTDDPDIAAGSGQDNDRLFIEETQPQLAVFKSFGGYRSATGGTTPLSIVGGVTIPIGYTLAGPVVLTDLLPEDMTWSNPPASGVANFTLSRSDVNLGSITGEVEYIPNYQASGRDLIRIGFDPSDFPTTPTGTGYFRLTPPSNLIRVSVPQEARSYNNSAEIFISGSGQNTSPDCGTASGTNISDFESEDPRDLDGDGETTQNHCSYGATLQAQALPGAAFGLTKKVQGELDPSPLGAGLVAETTNGGSGEYTLLWRNTATDPLTDPVVYDILPHVGDAGVDQGQSSTPRGSEFAVSFDEISHLDPGVTVEYSDSYNPCRPEVYPSAPGCVDDWASTPDDPADVKSLRFTASGEYTSGESFEMRFKVSLPQGEVNTIAWNSSASSAKVNGTSLLPAEPPKVGITAPKDPVTPTLSTQVSSDDLKPGDELTDTITVGGADNINGTADWTLYGPVDVADATDCDAVDWTGAQVADQGSLPTSGNGDFDTPATTLTEYGCYGYEVTISSPGFTDDVTSPVGSENEVAIIPRLAPTLATQVSSDDLKPGGELRDQITVAAADNVAGTAEWTLYGPVDVGDANDCDAADWSGATVADQGSLPITGNGNYETGASTLTEIGCYGYEVTIDSPGFGNPVTSPVGSENEVAIIRRLTPTVSTTISSARITPGGSVTDKVSVGGTEGRPGEIRWSLVGPVQMDANWSCDTVDWTGAPVIDSGTLATNGDGDYDTPATTLPGQGCYGYVVAIGGNAIGGSADSPAGSPNEVVLVRTEPGHLTETKKAGRKNVQAGSKVKYTIVVKNDGAGPVPDVKMVDRPAKPMKFISADPSQGTCNAKFPLTCELGTIEAGAKASVTVIAEPLVEGRIQNTATSTTPDPEVPPATDKATITGKVKLKIVKTAGRSKVRAGQRINYRIRISNPTPATARNVRVCDRPPAGLEVIRTQPNAKLVNGAWCWQIKRLAPHSSKTMRVIARTLKGAKGRITNVAWLEGKDIIRTKSRSAIRVTGAKQRPGGVTG